MSVCGLVQHRMIFYPSLVYLPVLRPQTCSDRLHFRVYCSLEIFIFQVLSIEIFLLGLSREIMTCSSLPRSARSRDLQLQQIKPVRLMSVLFLVCFLFCCSESLLSARIVSRIITVDTDCAFPFSLAFPSCHRLEDGKPASPPRPRSPFRRLVHWCIWLLSTPSRISAPAKRFAPSLLRCVVCVHFAHMKNL